MAAERGRGGQCEAGFGILVLRIQGVGLEFRAQVALGLGCLRAV